MRVRVQYSVGAIVREIWNIENRATRIKRKTIDPVCSRYPGVVSSLMEIVATYMCQCCFQINETSVDASGGMEQEYVEDCQVCCRPNLLRITLNSSMEQAEIDAEVP